MQMHDVRRNWWQLGWVGGKIGKSCERDGAEVGLHVKVPVKYR